MNKSFWSILTILPFALFVVNNSIAQNNNDEVLMTIGNSSITVTDFTNVYKKNNTAATVKDEKSINEYVDLFVNFKLKVKAAEELGLDTLDSFVNELAGYRKQLAEPYLTDKEVKTRLLKETYDRLKMEVDASHILVRCSVDAFPKDTLSAYNRVIKIRDRILKGESFSKVASIKGVSDDESAVDNAGRLGYFTALQMVYAFETAAYSTKAGDISMPVRTRFGYHIIKVHDTRAARGEVLVAHIMVKTPAKMSSGDSLSKISRINEIHQKLEAGEKFSSMANQFSDDANSSKKGGKLAWFGTSRMPIEFEKASFLLAKGDYCKPVQTQYGWHIIKLIDKKVLGSFDEMKKDLTIKVSKDSRSQVGRTSLISKVKNEYGFKETKGALEEFYKVIDSTLFVGLWNKTKAAELTKTMFNLNDKLYTQQDFAAYIAIRQSKRSVADIKMVVDKLYDQYVNESTVAYESARLDQKYPEFKALMQEYRDGILLFELTDQKVWSKAIKDTAGSKAYYEKNKTTYLWDERADAVIFNCINEKVAGQVRKLLKKNKSTKEILSIVNKDSQLNLSVESKLYSKGENTMVDDNWTPGVSKNIISESDKKIKVVYISKLLKPTPKSYVNSKGIVISDYQNYLEKQWIAELKKRFVVTINKKVLATVK